MSVSLVCVFNDPAVREQCLDRSVAGSDPATVELVVVDNTDHRFTTAGAALNHGARLARHDVVAFVHQDVYLHSTSRLLEVAALLRADAGGWGLLGAAGVGPGGEVVGLLRDRVQLIGRSAVEPVEVDSLDEVLFLVEREVVLREPLAEDPDLAWHAYAVEYGVRLRELGLRVGAVDLAITHNSLTVNLARLAEAHHRVAELHPGAVPVRTTCGIVGAEPGWLRSSAVGRRHGWRRRGLAESLVARRARERAGAGRPVLADVRLDVDDIEIVAGERVRVVNVDATGAFSAVAGDPLQLTRRGEPFELVAVHDATDLVAHLRSEMPGPLLCTNLDLDGLARLGAAGLVGGDAVIGIHESDIWLLTGVATDRLPRAWLTGRAVPFSALRPGAAGTQHRGSAGATAASAMALPAPRGGGRGVLH
ncbi:glycosyltransferase family A protein [Nocardioides conyzicola]|uniref:Glycosyltransferase n=1 Tax=Nocardioides conyzicola TaxID=1651781 RepID=A0ABP8XP02_9ACTN